MKKISILILSFCISISLYSQNLFNKIYNPNNTWATAFNVFPVDSGYVSCGVTGDSIYNKTNIIVSKYDANGNLIFFKEFKKDSSNCFAGGFSGGGFAKCKSGGYILAGGIENSHFTDFLIRLNPNFDTIWTKQLYKDTIFSCVYNCIETSNQNFVICGKRYFQESGGLTKVLLYKTDSMGNKLFEKYYDIILGAKGNRWDAGWNITETPDKGFLLGCYTYDNAYQGTGDGIVIKTDSLGNLAWMKNFGGPEKDAGLVTAVCNDGNYIVASSRAYYTADYNDYWSGKIRLTKIDTDGYIIWMKEYFGVIKGMSVTKIVQLSNGDFIFSGAKNHDADTTHVYDYMDSYLFKVNSNGDSIWCKEYLYPVIGSSQVAWNTIFNLELTPESGIVACGEIFYNTILPNNIWIFRTNEFGCLIPGCDLGVNEKSKKKGELQIFPNPSTTQTTITYPTAEKALMLQIYNMLGQKVYEEKIPKGSNQAIINTTGFKSGLYKVVVGESSASLMVNGY